MIGNDNYKKTTRTYDLLEVRHTDKGDEAEENDENPVAVESVFIFENSALYFRNKEIKLEGKHIAVKLIWMVFLLLVYPQPWVQKLCLTVEMTHRGKHCKILH